MKNVIVTIGGSDSLAGGGIQSDLLTFSHFDCIGLSTITSIVSITKNSFDIFPVPTDIVEKQLDSIFSEVTVSAIKIGLLYSLSTIDIVRHLLLRFPNIPVVLDPVCAFKESDVTFKNQYLEKLISELLPLATIITPNLKEAALLTNAREIRDISDMKKVADTLLSLSANSIVIKGGNRLAGTEAIVLFSSKTEHIVLSNPKINLSDINGAGCSFSSAIAANLIEHSALTAVKISKDTIYHGIQHSVLLNQSFRNIYL
jgi:pyridoxine kinase